MIRANAGVAFYFWDLIFFFLSVCANFGRNPACFPYDYTEVGSVGVLPVLTAHIARPSLGSQSEVLG